MLSIKKISGGSVSAAAKYFSNYYASEKENGEPPGRIIAGPDEARFDGDQELKREHIEAFLKGINPATGERMVKEIKPTMTADGKVREPVAAYDLTFSAPKSVSAAWASSPEHREAIEKAHNEAIKDALEYFKNNGITYRTGAGGKETQRGDTVIAQFDHSTSRNNDPQLHSHCVVAAMGKREDGAWSRPTVDMGQIHASGAVYQSSLADRLKKAGFEIEVKEGGTFRIAGIPKSLESKWSSRSKEIRDAMKERGETGTVKARAAAVETRSGKESPNRKENFARWEAEAAKLGFTKESLVAGKSKPSAPTMGKTDEQIIAEVMDKKVHCTAGQLARAVFNDSVGRTSVKEAEERLERIKSQMVEIVGQKNGRIEQRFTTKETIETEKKLVRDADHLSGNHRHGIGSAAVEKKIAQMDADLKKKNPDYGVTAEQKNMIRACTDERGLAFVQGHAGSGKTFTMKAVSDLYKSEGYQVIATSTGRNASDIIGKEIKGSATTLAFMKYHYKDGVTKIKELDPETGEHKEVNIKIDSETVIIMDEAGMTASADMQFILEVAREKGAKVIAVGDDKQLPPVAEGRPFQDLKNRHGFVELTEIRRQTSEEDREIGRLVRDGRAGEAIAKMEERGQFFAAASVKDARNDAAQAYADRVAAGSQVLMMAGTKAEVRELNRAAREKLREVGVLTGKDYKIQTSAGVREFAKGDRVIFGINDDKVTMTKNGTTGRVEKINEKQVSVRLDDGRLVTMPLDAKERHLESKAKLQALNVKIEMMEIREKKLEGKINSIFRSRDPEKLKSQYEELKSLREEITKGRREAAKTRSESDILKGQSEALEKIDHGHAVTVHKSQGMTVKEAIFYATGSVMEKAQLVYVALTRNIQQAMVFTTEKAKPKLAEQWSKFAEKDSLQGFEIKKPEPTRSDDPPRQPPPGQDPPRQPTPQQPGQQPQQPQQPGQQPTPTQQQPQQPQQPTPGQQPGTPQQPTPGQQPQQPTQQPTQQPSRDRGGGHE